MSETLPAAALRSWRSCYIELQTMPADHPRRPDVIAHLRDCVAIMADDPATAKARAIWEKNYWRAKNKQQDGERS